MRFAASAAAAFALLAAMAATGAGATPPIEAAFGNTVVSTYPDGKTQHLWLARDGTYTAKGRFGQDSAGRWSLKGEEVCLKQLRPFPVPFDYCTLVPQDAATASWTGKAVNGQTIRLRLVRGKTS